jgi:hypothetical protein
MSTKAVSNKRARRKQSTEMTPAELTAAAAIFDEEFAYEKSRPLNAGQKKLWTKAKTKMGRPKIGKGAKVVSVSLEKGLLSQVDKLAKRLGVSRASLVSRGLAALVKEQQ